MAGLYPNIAANARFGQKLELKLHEILWKSVDHGDILTLSDNERELTGIGKLKQFAVLTTMILLPLFASACTGMKEEAILPSIVTEGPSTAVTTTEDSPPAATTELSASEAVPIELSIEGLGNATYRGILDEPVTLASGHFEGQPFVAGGASRPIVTLLPETMAYGDLNGDGRTDAAVVLSSDLGGSGSFVYLAAVESRDGAPANTATILLGDREQVRSLTINGGRLLVELLSHRPDDPACCPSLETIRAFRLQGEQWLDDGSQ